MTNDAGRKPEAAPERSPKAGAGGPKRFSVHGPSWVVSRIFEARPIVRHRWTLAYDDTASQSPICPCLIAVQQPS